MWELIKLAVWLFIIVSVGGLIITLLLSGFGFVLIFLQSLFNRNK